MLKIQEKICLSPYTNYKIGGKAHYFCKVGDREDIKKALLFAKSKKLPVFLLGGGTNVLISDEGFKGLVVKLELNDFNVHLNEVKVGAGVKLASVVETSLKKQLGGLEWAAGIPGTVGGAVRGNAGAFGESMADIVKLVEVMNIKTLEMRNIEKKELCFDYRNSLVKQESNLVILNVYLKLKKNTTQEEQNKSAQKVQEHIAHRKEKQPLKYPSCGSVFKGIEKEGKIIPAGLLIEKAGLAGRKIGEAQISKKHSNFILNLGGARAKDVYALITLIQETVYKKFQLKLEPEVKLVGF